MTPFGEIDCLTHWKFNIDTKNAGLEKIDMGINATLPPTIIEVANGSISKTSFLYHRAISHWTMVVPLRFFRSWRLHNFIFYGWLETQS